MHTHATPTVDGAVITLSAGKASTVMRVVEPADSSSFTLKSVPVNIDNDKNYPDPGLVRIELSLTADAIKAGRRVVVQVGGAQAVSAVAPLASWPADGPLSS